MKLACDLFKPWLVPYSEGTLRIRRPLLHAAVRRHLKGCATCRQDEVLLHKTAMALRRQGQRSSSWIARGGRVGFPQYAPLSSRVLQSIQAERRKIAGWAGQSARRAYPVAAYGTAVVLLCAFFAFLTQPTIARPWFARYFLAHAHGAIAARQTPIVPPYPMHDPFAVPEGVGNAPFGLSGFSRPATSLSITPRLPSGNARSASLLPLAHSTSAKPALYDSFGLTGTNNVQAREAMQTAEKAEETRVTSQASWPSLPVAKPTLPTAQAPVSLPSSGVSNSLVSHGAVTLNGSSSTGAIAGVRPVAEIPDALPPGSVEPDSSTSASVPAPAPAPKTNSAAGGSDSANPAPPTSH